MAPKYDKGQKIIITPVKNQRLSPRDADIGEYAGQNGRIIDYYWIDLGRGTEAFYVYRVQTEIDKKEIVLHEDEIEVRFS